MNHDEWVCGPLHQIQSARAPPASISASLRPPLCIEPQTSATHPWFSGSTINADSVGSYLTNSHFTDHNMHDTCLLCFIIVSMHLSLITMSVYTLPSTNTQPGSSTNSTLTDQPSNLHFSILLVEHLNQSLDMPIHSMLIFIRHKLFTCHFSLTGSHT